MHNIYSTVSSYSTSSWYPLCIHLVILYIATTQYICIGNKFYRFGEDAMKNIVPVLPRLHSLVVGPGLGRDEHQLSITEVSLCKVLFVSYVYTCLSYSYLPVTFVFASYICICQLYSYLPVTFGFASYIRIYQLHLYLPVMFIRACYICICQLHLYLPVMFIFAS